MRFEIIEFKLEPNMRQTITADEIVSSHVIKKFETYFLILVVRRE